MTPGGAGGDPPPPPCRSAATPTPTPPRRDKPVLTGCLLRRVTHTHTHTPVSTAGGPRPWGVR